jgi:hypothetical protein
MPLALSDVFPDEDYRFHLTLRAGDVDQFFRSSQPEVLTERARWLNADPRRYAALTGTGEALLGEFAALAAQWIGGGTPPPESPFDRLLRLGAALEPDFLVLAPDGTGTFRLLAGVVCFPSSWALEEKIGRTLDEIHQPVPTLNSTLGFSISRFLSRLKPGTAFERANWGLAATPALNMHPRLNRPRLERSLSIENAWVRIEDQLLAALPSGAGILFGIRLRILPLRVILDDAAIAPRFIRAVETMPPDIAAYKGLSGYNFKSQRRR